MADTRFPRKEAYFITRNGVIHVRLADTRTSTMTGTARALGARYFVAVDCRSGGDAPTWGVFDRTVVLKTFSLDSLDGAVMWARHKEART